MSLNDIAINHAMDTYFEVDREDKLTFSLAVRKLFGMVLKQRIAKVEREKELKKR